VHTEVSFAMNITDHFPRDSNVDPQCVYCATPTSSYIIIIIIIIITMAQQPYMGSGLLLPPLFEVTKSCAFVAVGDWSTGRASVLSIVMWQPGPSGRQSGDLGEKWRQFGLRNIFIHAVNLRHGTDGFTSPPKEVVLRIFITLKN
jgi:hypothetical protein